MEEVRSESKPRWRVWVITALGVMALAGVGAWLLVDPLSVSEPKDRASAIGTVFTIGFGFGGLATLGLFTRRQWHQERVHEHERQVAADARREAERTYEHQQRVADDARYDAEQRRITEQYMQAVEQLGHEKAPVRLGGLYALDRLGRNHPEQRQVIAEVWCAYLRRKYTPPAEVIGVASTGEESEEEPDRSEERLKAGAEAADEYEVRMTAQRLLARHLKNPRSDEKYDDTRPTESEEYWHFDHLDLTGATLVDVDFTGCRFPTLKANHVRFFRAASFIGTYFEGYTEFVEAHFNNGAWFHGAEFGGVRFSKARFDGGAVFVGTHFAGGAWFGGASFDGDPLFSRADLEGRASVDDASFSGNALFIGAHFKNSVEFSWVRFGGNASFYGAQFEDRADFSNLRFGSDTDAAEAMPESSSWVVMSDAVVDRIDFEDRGHVWPLGWGAVADGDKWKLVPVEE